MTRRGRKPGVQSHENQQTVSNIEKLELVQWITQLTIAGYTPWSSAFKAMAETLGQRRLAKINESWN